MSDSPAPSPAPPSAAPSEARLRADARKAKIQARGDKGLAKLATTARGAEGAKMYETAPTPKRTPSTQSLTKTPAIPFDDFSAFSSPQAGGAAGTNPFGGPDGMPSPFGGMGANGEDPFAAMMKAMSGGAGGMPPGGGEGADNPFGGMFPPGMGMPPGGPGGAQDFEYSTKKTLSDKLFTLAHFLGVLGLVAFAVGWWEPRVLARRGVAERVAGEVGWGRYAAGAELPVFWAFVTLSLILQTTRLLLFRSRPPPSSLLSLLSPFLAFIPPNLKTYLFTASRYISMLTQFAQDLCVMVFAFGVVRWVQGRAVHGKSD